MDHIAAVLAFKSKYRFLYVELQLNKSIYYDIRYRIHAIWRKLTTMKRIQQLCLVFWDTYRLVRMNLPFSHEMNVLNAPKSEVTHQISAAEVAVSLQKLILKY